MKKVVIALVVLLGLGVGLLIGLKPYGVDLLGQAGVWDPETKLLYKKADKFLEALQYKDFKTAAAFHTWEDEQKADIPKLIERLFKVKPEQLNIRDVKITGVDFDEGRQRARTHFTCVMELLNSAKNEEEKNREKEVQGILYWHKRPSAEDDPPQVPIEGMDPEKQKQLTQLQAEADKDVLQTRFEGEEQEQWFLRLESSLENP